jgi:hypothetical protein
MFCHGESSPATGVIQLEDLMENPKTKITKQTPRVILLEANAYTPFEK